MINTKKNFTVGAPKWSFVRGEGGQKSRRERIPARDVHLLAADKHHALA